MSIGLPVSRLINVTVNLTPQAAVFLNFDTLLILGDSEVIDTSERIREFDTLDEVASSFPTSSPEYLAAQLFFSQIPQPDVVFIGRWAQTATKGSLKCGVLSADEQAMASWIAITNGGVNFTIDGTAKNLTALDFHLCANLNAVATVIDTALNGGSVVWNGSQFVVKSDTTGTSSTVSYATAGTGTDISAKMKATSASGASTPVPGIAAETIADCIVAMDQLSTNWYGVMLATTHVTTTSEYLQVAAYIQGSGNRHIFGVTSADAHIVDSGQTDDIAYQLKAAGYTRSFVQYSNNKYAAASFFGRAFSVNFDENNSTITLMYKQEPGVVPEGLTSAQMAALETKRANIFVKYNNDTAIIERGTMAGAAYFDEIHGLDWLANRIQTDVWNLFYTSPTKIPQTDAGTHQIATVCEASCAAGVWNGLLAPGTWNSAGFGLLKQGDFLAKGYYVFPNPIATQAQADREARKSPPIQIAAKLAGAIHTVDITVNVNR